MQLASISSANSMIANGKQIQGGELAALTWHVLAFSLFANYRSAMQIPRFTPQMEAIAV